VGYVFLESCISGTLYTLHSHNNSPIGELIFFGSDKKNIKKILSLRLENEQMDSIRFLYHQAKPALEAETIPFSDDRGKTQNHAKLWFDYYPFGSIMPGRNYASDGYRFGFNGQEKVDEIAGTGNHNTALYWEYDTRLGRRWNLDPVDQISISNYAVLANNPIWFKDPYGDTWGDDESAEKGDELINEAKIKKDAFDEKAKSYDQKASRFMRNGKDTETSLTYKALAQEARKGAASMQQLINDITAMGDENNPIEFFYKKKSGTTGYTSMNKAGQVIMEYVSNVNAVHESTHGGQHLRGSITLLYGSFHNYDLTDEKEAYTVQYFFGGKMSMPFIVRNSGDITVEIIKTMPEYKDLLPFSMPENRTYLMKLPSYLPQHVSNLLFK